MQKNQQKIFVVSLLTALLTINNLAQAQVKIGNNPTAIDARSVLEIESDDQALYLPRLTTAQLGAVTGWKEGMVLYNTDEDCIKIFDGNSWEPVDSDLSGIYNGDGTTPADVDITITDNIDFDASTFFIDGTNDRIGIGTTAPLASLDIKVLDTIGLLVRSGNSSSSSNYSQLSFGYNNSSYYKHAIKTRHSSHSNSGNAIDFFVWSVGQNINDAPSNHIMTIDGKGVGIGTTTPAYKLEVSGEIMLENVAAPSAISGHSGIYSSGGELRAIDQWGNHTVISPHHFSLVKPSEEMAWSFYSKNKNIGHQVNVDMMKAMRVLENLSGEKLVHKADLNGTEILEENTKETSLKEQLTLQNQRIKDQDLLIQKLTERIDQLERNTKTN